jgi:AcrR family transcriptional regulator
MLVVGAAVALADREGIAALSMRRLGKEVGVEAMSLYNHVTGKSDLLDGMVDAVFAEIDFPTEGSDWKAAMRSRAHSARNVLTGHPWAIGLLDSRTTPGPATRAHHESVIGTLRRAGFTIEMAAHAFAALDSYTYGFVLQETAVPFEDPGQASALAQQMIELIPADDYPNLHDMATDHVMKPGYDFGDEFGFGLGLVLDGLERARSQ